VVLGAGATRGADLNPVGKDKQPRVAGPVPPLDGDFFTQAQLLSGERPGEYLQDLIDGAVKNFGENFRLTMEGFLTQIEYMSDVFRTLRLKGRPARNPFPALRNAFLQVLAALLDQSVGREPNCRYHTQLVDSLSLKDTIVSFNYDWVIDWTLKRHHKKKWNPRIGYGVPCYRNSVKYWEPQKLPAGNRSIILLKMHGSLNWFRCERKPNFRLKLRRRWWHQYGDLDFEIIPPEWNKPISSPLYQKVWRTARQRLKDCQCLAFLGYSLPSTDLPAQALLRADAGDARKLKVLVIANPDREARFRIREVVSKRLDRGTRILSFDSFKDFAEFLGPLPEASRPIDKK